VALGYESGFETVKCYTNARWYFYLYHLLLENVREKRLGRFVYLFSWSNLKMQWVDLAHGSTLLYAIDVTLKSVD
jgi:hypothetical protein